MSSAKAWQLCSLPLSWLYGFAVWSRNFCYDTGFFRVQRVRVPVISVGNITVGGTGKTPFVEYLIKHFIAKDKKVAVLSRGYKRKSHGPVSVAGNQADRGNAALLGDEPYQIARKFPQAAILVDRKRARAAEQAATRYGADIILLDDGFQHRSLARNLDIVMLDGREPLPEIPMLPAGRRREPLSALKRAQVLAFSRPLSAVQQLPFGNSGPLQLKVEFVPKRLHRVGRENSSELNEVRGKSCVAFCAIAKPESFKDTLVSIGVNVAEFIRFGDHHRYSMSDVRKIQNSFNQHRPDFIITTEKDSVRLLSNEQAEDLTSYPVWYIEIEARIIDKESKFHELLDKIVQ